MDSEVPSAYEAQTNSTDDAVETITIHVRPTTGGQFEIEIPADESAEELRRRISRRFQTPKERLKILYNDQVLESKSLKDYKVTDGSKVTLLPSVESGFSSTVQGTQQSIIQAIESLSDPQIDDFLSGRLPLTLALRVGDHMMFVQLQLEQSQVNSPTVEQRPSRGHPSTALNQIGHSAQSLMSHRLFAKMPTVPITTSQLGATTVLPESPVDFNAKKSSPSRTVNSPIMTEPGPSPKVAKLSPKSDVTDRSDYIKSGSNTTGLIHKSHHFHHRHLSPPIPEELPYAIFDPAFDSLQQISRYSQIASHLSHHAQSNASHLHRLVTACSSLEPVMTVPPSGVGKPVNVPHSQEHTKKSSRKRPSATFTPNTSVLRQTSSQMSSYNETIEQSLPTTAALIQNALMRHQQLGGAFPPPPAASLLSSAYAKYQESTRASQSVKTTQSGSTKPTSPPAVIRSKHPITSTMLQTSPIGGRSSGHSSRSEKHHKRAPTSGRVTSGSLSHHTSGMSGARVARQMQRLRRLCGSHQQCVAYSNRELATEISSIVHMARHSHHQHSRSEGSSHRKSHKGCTECHRHTASSSAGSSRNPTAQPGQTTGACIDSFTTHGPGIFSGTFSGSLHPSIQDPDGKPKRDPKTILQILTDLLNATHQYQGQLGNVGLLPQLFKDHFKSEAESAMNKESSAASAPANNKSSEMTSSSQTRSATGKAASQSHQKLQTSKHNTHQRHAYPYMVPPPAMSQNAKIPAPAQYLSSVSTIPIGTLPLAYNARPQTSSRSSRRSALNQEGCNKHHRHHSSRCHHHRSHGVEKQTCCGSSSCRRQAKQMLNASYLKREHENNNTRNKMKELKKVMERQRHRRQFRRATTKVCNKRNGTEADDIKSLLSTAEPIAPVEVHDGDSEVKSGEMEVQFDGIKDYEIKEVAHEPPETVTV